jgi:hypothetical protein
MKSNSGEHDAHARHLQEMMMPYVQLESGTIFETADVSLWPEAKRLSKAKGKVAMREFAFTELHKILRPGDDVTCILRNVSRSGMSRRIDFYAPGKTTDSGMLYLTQFFAWLLDEKMSKGEQGMVVGGCGMDMGFHIVYNASSALWPKGFQCIGVKRRCPSNDHSNGDRNYARHLHASGGYALRHRWL